MKGLKAVCLWLAFVGSFILINHIFKLSLSNEDGVLGIFSLTFLAIGVSL
jgi:hypothetical protein